MKVNDLRNKIEGIEKLYTPLHWFGDNGEYEGNYTTLEEAKAQAEELKYRYYNDAKFEIHELIWSEEEKEYIFQEEDGCLIDPIAII